MSDLSHAVTTDKVEIQFGKSTSKDDRAEQTFITIVESRRLYRECLAMLLARAFPNSAIEARDCVDDVSSGRKNLILLCFDRDAIRSPLAVKRQVDMARSVCDGAPIAIVLDEFDRNAASVLAKVGIAGLAESSSCASTVVEMVRAILSDGNGKSNGLHGGQPVDGRLGRDEAHFISAKASESPSSQRLTARESDIMRSLRAGVQNKTIAFQLGISESTVKVHLRNLMLKFKAHNRVQLLMAANGQTRIEVDDATLDDLQI